MILKSILWNFITYFCYPVTIMLSGIFTSSIQCLLYLFVKPWSKYLYRKINYYLSFALLTQISAYATWFSKLEINLYMDKNDFKKIGKEHAFVVMNHTFEVDWVLTICITDSMNCGGNFKHSTKKFVRYMPSIGWCLFFSDFILLERSFEKDKDVIVNTVTEMVAYPDPIFFVLCPEGTRYTPEKYIASAEFAKQRGLPELKHHLTPRTKGFITCLPPMRGKMDAVYDMTISFDSKAKNPPTFLSLYLGRPIEANIYIKRIPFDQVPQGDEEATAFLFDMFKRKDMLQDSFLKTGDFFTESGIERVEKYKLRKNIYSLINLVMWNIIVIVSLLYFLINLLLSATISTILLVFGFILAILGLFYIGFTWTQTQHGSSYGIENGNNKKC